MELNAYVQRDCVHRQAMYGQYYTSMNRRKSNHTPEYALARSSTPSTRTNAPSSARMRQLEALRLRRQLGDTRHDSRRIIKRTMAKASSYCGLTECGALSRAPTLSYMPSSYEPLSTSDNEPVQPVQKPRSRSRLVLVILTCVFLVVGAWKWSVQTPEGSASDPPLGNTSPEGDNETLPDTTMSGKYSVG